MKSEGYSGSALTRALGHQVRGCERVGPRKEGPPVRTGLHHRQVRGRSRQREVHPSVPRLYRAVRPDAERGRTSEVGRAARQQLQARGRRPEGSDLGGEETWQDGVRPVAIVDEMACAVRNLLVLAEAMLVMWAQTNPIAPGLVAVEAIPEGQRKAQSPSNIGSDRRRPRCRKWRTWKPGGAGPRAALVAENVARFPKHLYTRALCQVDNSR